MQYTTLLLGLLGNAALARAAFSTTCPQLYYTTGALEGDCFDSANNWTYNYLEISNCLGVSKAGKLVWKSGGSYQSVCVNVALSADYSTLTALCPNSSGTLVSTSINLNEQISNNDGTLCCSNAACF